MDGIYKTTDREWKPWETLHKLYEAGQKDFEPKLLRVDYCHLTILVFRLFIFKITNTIYMILLRDLTPCKQVIQFTGVVLNVNRKVNW